MLQPLPAFDEFYRAVNRRNPFPWQTRLAEFVASGDVWPSAIGIQTGLGKTACLDVAIWWLASQATRSPCERTAPTRIWWVVNRRLLVDSTAEHAEAIREQLNHADSADSEPAKKVIAAVAHRLRSLRADPQGDPLEVIRLRGGIASSTPTDPSCPAVILCTLPMYGSRLLFRGYGSSSRPVDAAMAGTDSLVLLDEAHLAPHLRHLLPALAECHPRIEPILNQSRATARLVELTATGDTEGSERFAIDAADEANPIVRKRLDAAKPLQIRVETPGGAAKHLVDATKDLLKSSIAPASCLVFTNSPKTGREAFGRLRKAFPDSTAEVLLLTGLVREHEAEHIRARVLDSIHGMGANPDKRNNRKRHFIVVATQTLEVGADIDAEYLVTEACGVRALTQRLGRLNRLGLYPHSKAVYVHVPPTGRKGVEPDEWPVYGKEPKRLLTTLQQTCRDNHDPVVYLDPGRIASVLGPPVEPQNRPPEILPGLLWEWTKTTTPPSEEAPVDPYFSGITGPQFSVSVIWRSYVPNTDERLWPRASDREAIDVPISDLRQIFKGDRLHRIMPDRMTIEQTIGNELQPGDHVVLPTDCGLLDDFGWNPTISCQVRDVSLRERGLPLDRAAIERLCNANIGEDLDSLIQCAQGADDYEDANLTQRNLAVQEILARLKAVKTPSGWESAEWSSYVSSLHSKVVTPRHEVARLYVANSTRDSLNRDLDETSLAPSAITLEQHGLAVATRARAVAERIGLSANLCDVVEQAGKFHDIGKADRRFQRWLDPDGSGTSLVAKSNMPRDRWEEARVSAGWPRGGRHEALSCRVIRLLMKETSALYRFSFDPVPCQDLLLHIVASHHGNGRPLILPVKDGTKDKLTFSTAGHTVTVPTDLEDIDWDQPTRFRKLNDFFGPWALALLEAVLIRSDHWVSGSEEAAS